jgi:hypothetical protein
LTVPESSFRMSSTLLLRARDTHCRRRSIRSPNRAPNGNRRFGRCHGDGGHDATF